MTLSKYEHFKNWVHVVFIQQKSEKIKQRVSQTFILPTFIPTSIIQHQQEYKDKFMELCFQQILTLSPIEDNCEIFFDCVLSLLPHIPLHTFDSYFIQTHTSGPSWATS